VPYRKYGYDRGSGHRFSAMSRPARVAGIAIIRRWQTLAIFAGEPFDQRQGDCVALDHDPEKWEPVFSLATNAKRLREDHAQTKT